VSDIWYTRPDGTEAPRTRPRIHAFCALSTAGSRWSDAPRWHPPGSAAAVARAELLTNLADRRVAHTLACGHDPQDVQRDGLLTLEAALEFRRGERERPHVEL